MILRRLFGGGDPPAPELPVVRNITIGRGVQLDTLAWRRLQGTAFTLDRDTLEIVAQGRITLDDGGGHVHRFYTQDDIMLQAVSASADGHDADDFTLFIPWSSAYPRAGERAGFEDRLQQARWDEPDVGTFGRFWYPGDDGPQPPVRLWEAVHEARSGPPARHIEQACMLYSRDLGEDSELLLAIAMKPERGELTHEIMIGVPLAPGELSA
ncbi:YjfK family protein [Sphingobium sufflavum]|uniref:DUF2491 family protein n=1 Tax=Sphingobium sufflavum TaxID=1129547 RepID=UPI001F1B45E7|nr:DUF2491 family protein [Sphingobium sufflavum]MCE7796192.1 YjfK family protein [Sphingobium sufflavum]